MNENKLCPVCGSDKLERVVQKESINGDLGKNLFVDIPHAKCNVCGFEGDFFGENEKVIEKALSTLDKAYIEDALNYFNESKINFAGIERAIGLPQRTLTKWKSGNSMPTAAGIALLKFLRTFPWLIEVAENKYDFNIAHKIFIGAALGMLLKTMNFNDKDVENYGYSTTSGNFYTNIYADSFYVMPESKITVNYVQKGNG